MARFLGQGAEGKATFKIYDHLENARPEGQSLNTGADFFEI